MGTENITSLHASGDTGFANKDDDPNNIHDGHSEVNSQGTNCEDRENKLNTEEAGYKGDAQDEDGCRLPEANSEKNLIESDSDMEIEDLNSVPALIDSSHRINSNEITQCKDNHCSPKPINDVIENSSLEQVTIKTTENVAVAEVSNVRLPAVSGVKRKRMMSDEQQPSVCVKYSSLTRASKNKLEELLQQWSEWHAQRYSSSKDPTEPLESGEDTFFPALHVGLEKTSSVSFWMDKKTRNHDINDFTPLDSNSVPLYDRGYALGLTSDGSSSNAEGGQKIIDDAARCFNCGSYSHALKECPKPRDRVAVNNARKQHKSKRNQNSASRNPARYYQDSPTGKYDGLRPGALDAEARKLLGLGDLDPPPWLNRMREIGYPPGYLDPDEDQPSGITIFGDVEIKEDQEDGEILETKVVEPVLKMTVKFPGVNAPIPENADHRLWAQTSSVDNLRLRSHRGSNHSSEFSSRGHHREERRSRDYRDDGPPGVDLASSYTSMSTHLPRFGSYESGHNSHSPRLNPIPPILGRFELDRGRRSRYGDESHAFSPHSSRLSPIDHGWDRFESRNDERNDPRLDRFGDRIVDERRDYGFDHPWDCSDRHRHHSRR